MVIKPVTGADISRVGEVQGSQLVFGDVLGDELERLPIMETSGSPPVASAVVNFWACSDQGTVSIWTVMLGWRASKLLMLALRGSMLGASVWVSQKVTVCLPLAVAGSRKPSACDGGSG